MLERAPPDYFGGFLIFVSTLIFSLKNQASNGVKSRASSRGAGVL